ncbi:hypothetical protein [Candidatus Pantoea soli]|nr:hypothetical protein [Pantoea soli]
MITEALRRLRAAMQHADMEIMIVDHGELLAWLTGIPFLKPCNVPVWFL